ncbi:hypothetical protein Shyhy02_73690 [Streptomyces hygroscopicus subsp. hygroscopicus]|nr:hypothetical protein Shyhy02_73690 [Streptomyces hygroscopicus subsp. hygroscopicus]
MRGGGPHTALNGVHAYVAGLRGALESTRRRRQSENVVLSATGGYELRLPLKSVDAALFTLQCEED